MTSGSVRLAADGVVGSSGHPVRVYNVVALSGATAGVLVLRNGTSASGTIYVQTTCPTVSETNTFNFCGGLTFPDGCFFDIDTNISAVVVNYEQLG
jgi:hypothetical protein